MDISVVIPVYNEEESIDILVKRLLGSVKTITEEYEIIFINDGSTDKSLDLIKNYSNTNRKIHYISFSRNFGHQNAIWAGIENSHGKAVVIMDGDLQDPPEIIPELFSKFIQGYKVVYAKRKIRKGESFLKKILAKFFYRILKKITSVNIPLDTGDFRLISADVVTQLKKMKETNRFLRGQIAWLGYRQIHVEFERDERIFGKTKYTYGKMFKLAMTGITSFSNFPLQIAVFLGFFVSLIAFCIMMYALYSKFILEQAITGWTSIMISTMLVSGIHLLCIGIIGEYISRMANDIRKRPDYIIEESNIESE